jgi:hypothetical protein
VKKRQVKNSFAREAAFVKQILIEIRYGAPYGSVPPSPAKARLKKERDAALRSTAILGWRSA